MVIKSLLWKRYDITCDSLETYDVRLPSFCAMAYGFHATCCISSNCVKMCVEVMSPYFEVLKVAAWFVPPPCMVTVRRYWVQLRPKQMSFRFPTESEFRFLPSERNRPAYSFDAFFTARKILSWARNVDTHMYGYTYIISIIIIIHINNILLFSPSLVKIPMIKSNIVKNVWSLERLSFSITLVLKSLAKGDFVKALRQNRDPLENKVDALRSSEVSNTRRQIFVRNFDPLLAEWSESFIRQGYEYMRLGNGIIVGAFPGDFCISYL